MRVEQPYVTAKFSRWQTKYTWFCFLFFVVTFQDILSTSFFRVVVTVDRPQSWSPIQPEIVITFYLKSISSEVSTGVQCCWYCTVCVCVCISLSSMVQNYESKQIIYVQGTSIIRERIRVLLMLIAGICKSLLMFKNTKFILGT